MNIRIIPNATTDSNTKIFEADGKYFKVVKKKIKRSKANPKKDQARFVCIHVEVAGRLMKKCYPIEQLLAESKKLEKSKKQLFLDETMTVLESAPTLSPKYSPIIDPKLMLMRSPLMSTSSSRSAPEPSYSLPQTEFQRRSDVEIESEKKETGNDITVQLESLSHGSHPVIDPLDPLKVDQTKTSAIEQQQPPPPPPSLNLYEYKAEPIGAMLYSKIDNNEVCKKSLPNRPPDGVTWAKNFKNIFFQISI